MTPTDVQRLLAAAGYYRGAIDGVVAQQTLAAVDRLLAARAAECSSDPARWSPKRRLVGAGQLVLKHAGYPVGTIDGYAGNQTAGALMAWNQQQATGKPLVLDRAPTGATISAIRFPRQAECDAFYGKPGAAVQAQLVMVDLPFPMRIDWNLGQTTRRAQLHRKCADSAVAALRAIVAHYGEARLRSLGLDRHAGTYNHRRMRGGSAWSMHAYGCAWDFYAAPNGLTTRCPQALFCREEYRAFFDIWEVHGWISLGRAIGRDWMHVQAARL